METGWGLKGSGVRVLRVPLMGIVIFIVFAPLSLLAVYGLGYYQGWKSGSSEMRNRFLRMMG